MDFLALISHLAYCYVLQDIYNFLLRLNNGSFIVTLFFWLEGGQNYRPMGKFIRNSIYTPGWNSFRSPGIPSVVLQFLQEFRNSSESPGIVLQIDENLDETVLEHLENH